MWDFGHDPLQAPLRERYDVRLTEPSQCARELLAGRADLGLIPIAALTPDLRIVPGCTIASRASRTLHPAHRQAATRARGRPERRHRHRIAQLCRVR